MLDSLFFDNVAADEVKVAHEIELKGFPPDEAATLEAFQFRHAKVPDLFLGAFLPAHDGKRLLIGYANATLSSAETLTHASMSHHDPAGRSVCIHAVCVREEYRRRGIASAILKEYLRRLAATNATREKPAYDRALLIAHEDMRGLYERAGFVWLEKSDVVHGNRPWFEMRWDVPAPTPAPQQAIPAGLWDALQASSRKKRPGGRLLSELSGIEAAALADEKTGGTVNAFDLLCPRAGCGSLILRKGHALLEERESVQMEPPANPNPHLAPLPAPPAKTHWWLVAPSPMEFENIGFSRSVGTAGASDGGKQLKFLICADCDIGPLGWQEVGGTQFWVAAERVRYRL
ncbi:acyl-CoA N-acyltransferase [Vararia minispora EC-137]|uniref:Acyl-CoA N-acyltransferase n=1 Tax=Vararia minispora EC-137 TaxID=1314806 RepID=A0ACB8QEF8_9AGAM|nr:acyl-CoA N-acyltransferase [Vararia minispora EC-137]